MCSTTNKTIIIPNQLTSIVRCYQKYFNIKQPKQLQSDPRNLSRKKLFLAMLLIQIVIKEDVQCFNQAIRVARRASFPPLPKSRADVHNALNLTCIHITHNIALESRVINIRGFIINVTNFIITCFTFPLSSFGGGRLVAGVPF